MGKLWWVVLSLSILIGHANAQEAYTAKVDVESTKTNGKAWDVAGGAPDIQLRIDEVDVPFNQKCRDRYRCQTSFISNRSEWYIEIYDKDFNTPDLIGRGKCELGKVCRMGQAMIIITK